MMSSVERIKYYSESVAVEEELMLAEYPYLDSASASASVGGGSKRRIVISQVW